MAEAKAEAKAEFEFGILKTPCTSSPCMVGTYMYICVSLWGHSGPWLIE